MLNLSLKAMKILATLQAIVIVTSLAMGQSKPQYGFKMVKPRVSTSLSFEDRFIKIQFGILTRVIFQLTNKTANPIEILWDRVSFVDTESEAHRVIHEGVRYIERDRALPPTIIPPGASASDSLFPTDYISYDSKESEWKVRDLFEPSISRYKGETFSVFLPLKVNGRIANYNFSF